MKNKFILVIFLLTVVPYAFSQKVVSLNALFTEQDAVLVPQVEGSYSVPDFLMTVSINKAGDNFYFLKYGSEINPVFEAVFVKINDELFLDMSSVMSDTIGDEDYRNGFIKSHTFYKVRLTKDTLQLNELNYAWLYDYTLKIKLPLSYEWSDNAMLLTLKTEELKSFFVGHKNDKDVFKNFIILLRKPSKMEKITTCENSSGYQIPKNSSQKCNPEFPLKDGWLGGDGDVSVSVSATQTLFIFSDTYVGNKNQQNREEAEMKMVSNTVEVETCLPNRKADIHYFWNNMYSDNPEPIFKSFTNRYRFWVNDAFIYQSYLYVLLEKIAPKQGASPDDIFAFSQIGFTLAKIVNPLELPYNWRIEYIPLPDFVSPHLGIRSHVKQENFIYFFVNRNDNVQFLVRKNLDFIDNSEKSFEYYALNKTWKAGIKADDMDTVIYGFRGNTVNYHSDIKQWIMICDIKFLDNKIRIRTSPSLTGPWSEEKIIYECPEVMPGTTSYSKSNFCYLARECIQNYDEEKHSMLITYDINNSDFSEIKSNLKIYTPKVIKVSLKEYVSR